MTANVYGEALHKAINDGVKPADAFTRLKDILVRHGRTGLYGRVLMDAQLRFHKDEAQKTATIMVARAKDEKLFATEINAFIKEHGIDHADVMVDENLIGGFVARGAMHELDRSYRRSLLTIYTSLTA